MESTLAAVARVACGLASAAMLLAWSPAIRSEPWTHSWGGSCTSSQIWHGAAPEDVARQYADALATCAPDDRPYFKYCDPPHVANSQFAVAGCYYHNTTPSGSPVDWSEGVSKACTGGRLIEAGSWQCKCPSGLLDSDGACVAACPADKPVLQAGKCYARPPKDGPPPPECCKANPLNAANGAKIESDMVYRTSGAGGFEFILTYNGIPPTQDWEDVRDGPFGRNRSSRYTASVKPRRLNTVGVLRPDGRELPFTPPGSGETYLGDADVSDRLERLMDGTNPVGWRYTTSDDEIELYDASGRLLSITTRPGQVTRLSYSDGQNGVLYP